MAHVKLRPLVIHDPASSQPYFGDAYGSDTSPGVRAHCSIPASAPRTSVTSLSPAPPADTGSGGSIEDKGASKLRNKLRRLLGAHSSSNNNTTAANGQPPNGANAKASAAAALETANLRSVSSSELHERSPSFTRALSSVPVSPMFANGHRGRLGVSSNNHPQVTLASPVTPGSSSCASSQAPSPGPGMLTGRSSVPTPPTGASPSMQCPGGGGGGNGNGSSRPANSPLGGASSRGPSVPIRRAVSFSPATNAAFPQLGAPNPPPPPQQQQQPAMLGSPVGSGGGVGPAGGVSGSRPSSTPSLTVGAAARLSNMVVVPEDEALGEGATSQEAHRGLPSYPSGIYRGNSLDLVQTRALRSGLSLNAGAVSPSPIELYEAGLMTSHLEAGGNISPLPVHGAVSGGVSPNVGRMGGLRPSSPFDARRTSRSSSSNHPLTNLSATGYITVGAPSVLPERDSWGGERSLAGAATPPYLIAPWGSDAAAGPFSAASTTAAIAAMSEGRGSSSSPSSKSPSAGPGSNAMQRSDSGRHASSPRPGGASSSPHPSPPAAHPQAPPHGPGQQAGSHAHPHALPHAHPLAQVLAQAHSVPSGVPGITRGLSAFNLLPGGSGGGGRGSSPWNTNGGGAAATTATATAAAGPVTGHPVNGGMEPSSLPQSVNGVSSASVVTPAVAGNAGNDPKSPVAALKHAPVRRALSTLDATARPAVETQAVQEGVVIALGASMPPEMKRKEWRMEDFTMLKKLYKGNYSSVHKALCRISMRLVVIKVYDTTRMTELARNHVKREAALHAPLQHDNILSLYAVFAQGPYVMLVEEVAEGGDLYHVLKGVPGHRLQEDRVVAGVLVPLLRSLSYLHEQGICHRDIKLENILFADRQHTRMLLADFGIALSLREERAVTRAGTTEYMSPEQLRCPFKRHPKDNKERTDLHYGLGVDVWATGVLTFELLHGYPPFLGNTREETEQLIITAGVVVAPQLSSGARDFVMSCLQKDPIDRPTVPQLLQHTWVRQYARQLRPGS